jgi:dTDP-4-dehydrorhamnose reductase
VTLRLVLPSPLELWGGFECSVVRVGGVWRDQFRETGHHDRPHDIDAAADLGVRTVRYPFLWERAESSWSWHDARMGRLRALGLGVVGGLLHHGSGPAGTDLLHPLLPERLAAHAGQVARRYPDITLWTPVNEPLTTARFSCLYGFWYPHRRDTDAFLFAVANQCRATLLAMRAIRAHVPHATLMATEDLGRIFSTAPLRAQAAYENQRRWLSLDLLTGRVDAHHPWRAAFEQAGVPARDLDELASGEASPDLIGANHYVTSDRFLDHRTALYPPHLRGGNDRRSYADTEAVRIDLNGGPYAQGPLGWRARLGEVWERYRLPIVVSEAHLGCDDDAEQARWFDEAWTAASTLRSEGVDVRAVTAWALAGLVDWDSLMRARTGRIEPGVWRQGPDGARVPRLAARLLRGLGRDGHFDHPALRQPGWWQRKDRFDVRKQQA